MNDDYYQTLGVSKTATQDEIQSSYRKLARKYHPDLNQNDPNGAKQKFQKVQEAFDILGKPEKRKIYDQFGVSPDQMGSGGGQGPFQWSFGGGAPGGNPFRSGNFNGNIDEILKMFGGGNGFGSGQSAEDFFGGGRRPKSGTDYEQNITIPFPLSITGGKIDLKIRRPAGGEETIVVTIPQGITDGKKIRLPGLGNPGQSGGKPGNLLITVLIDEHPFFSRKGDNLYVKLPISLKEAVFGAKIDVPTPTGNVTLTIPAGSSSGMKLRIKQCGVVSPSGNRGDLFAELSVVLPKTWTAADKTLLQQLTSEPAEPIRGDLNWY